MSHGLHVRPKRRGSRRTSAMLAAVCVSMLSLAGSTANAAGSHALIDGTGSSWAANAVNQWVADVRSYGLQVVFTSTGSATGRKDFANRTTDYAVSDIGYLGRDPQTGEDDTSQGRAYAYLPIVAGGTSFPYQVRVAGKLIRNIRLSGQTLAKIFTNQISMWNDPQIKKDNNNRADLPALPIIPIVHSEGSGSTAQFTRYLDKEYPSIWRPYNGNTAGFTEYFPRHDPQVAENGSDSVMNFLTSASANGAIGYDEYSYALAKNFPVVKIENSAGFFTAPTQYNVAVALTQAQINMNKSSPDYLLQNLDKVYAYSDKRSYPLSSYSYGIIPTASDDARMTTAKRQTLADFLSYAVCQGQAEEGPTGYSPLPINLVQSSFDQVAKLKQADSNVSLAQAQVSKCNNPTFIKGQPSRNYLAEIAPQPPACDQSGHGPCSGTEGLVNGNPVGGHASGGTSGSTPLGSSGSSAGSSGGTGSSAGSGSTKTPGGVTLPSGGKIQLPGGATGGTNGTDGNASVDYSTVLAGQPTALPLESGSGAGLGLIAAALFLALLFVPPMLWGRGRNRSAS